MPTWPGGGLAKESQRAGKAYWFRGELVEWTLERRQRCTPLGLRKGELSISIGIGDGLEMLGLGDRYLD